MFEIPINMDSAVNNQLVNFRLFYIMNRCDLMQMQKKLFNNETDRTSRCSTLFIYQSHILFHKNTYREQTIITFIKIYNISLFLYGKFITIYFK